MGSATLREAPQSLERSVEFIERHLSSVLVPHESRDHIRKVARLLPLAAVDFFGFECTLGNDISPADCAFNLTPEGARMLAENSSTFAPEMQHAPWDRVREFYKIWADTAVNRYADAGSTWFEFDASAGAPAPNMLFGYWPRKNPKRTSEWLADAVIPLLLNAPMSPLFRRMFLQCFQTLPPETTDFQIGVMLSRSIPAVRLCVFDVPNDCLFTWLESIAWKGNVSELSRYVEALRPHCDFLGFHLDVGEKVYPHIGVEPNFTAACWSRQPPRERRWHGQFEQLIAADLMTPEKRRALLSWIGHATIESGEREVLLLRGLSHFKVVLRPDRPATAKAYFGIAHRVLGQAQG